MLMLAFVFQTLAVRKPDLDAGVYAYAKAGFGEYLGFFSAFGYWASSCVGNVTYWVLIMSTVGALAPGARRRRHVARGRAVDASGIWVFYLLIRRGVKEAAVDQPDRHRRQGRPDPGVHPARALRPRPAGVRRQLERQQRRRLAVRPGQGHDAGDRLRVPRRRGRERLLPARRAPRGRRPGHRPGLPERVRRLRLGDDRVLRDPAVRRDRRAAPAVDGRRARGGGRASGARSSSASG